MDITPENSHDNLVRLSSALHALDARLRSDAVEGGIAFHHDAGSLAAANVRNLTTSHGDLDISFVPSGTKGYADLNSSAEPISVFDIVVRVATLADVVRSKQAANRGKDQRVLPTLRDLLANRDTGRP